MAEMKQSTYQQVRENMEKLAAFIGDGDITSIKEIIDRIIALEEDMDKIMNPGGGGSGTGGSDIVPDEDGNLMVMGVRVLTEFSDTDTTPNAYLRDVTFELKKTSVIGLSGVEGFTNEYVLVITYKHNLALNESVDLYNYKPQQLAYGDSMTIYGRIAQEGNAAWNNWFPISSAGGGDGGNNFIVSDSEPQDQEEGDYWAEPLD